MKKTVCLILPRFKYPSGDMFLGLAFLSAYLKKNIEDIDVRLIDATFNPSMDFVESELRKHDPGIVAIYMGTIMFGYGLTVTKAAKGMGINVVVGGPHPTIAPDSVIKDDCVDAIVLGEGEITLCEYVEAFFGDRDFNNIDGLWFKQAGEITKNKPRAPVADLDTLPFPDLDIYDVEKYMKNWIQLESVNPKLRGLPIIASRGCPFKCTYCQPTLNRIFGKKLRIRSPQNVVDELLLLKSRYHIDSFYFMDDTFTALKPWVMEFSGLLVKNNLNMKWMCNTRADTYDLEMLRAMQESGLIKVKVGIESICERIRNDIFKKNVSCDKINSLIRDCRDLGIQVAGFFMIGTPTETKQEILKTIKFAVGSGLMEAVFTITTPLPETFLYDLARQNDWAVPENYEDYDYFKAGKYLEGSEVSWKALERYKILAYCLFYFHPKRIGNTIRMSLSPNGFKRMILKLQRL